MILEGARPRPPVALDILCESTPEFIQNITVAAREDARPPN